MHYRHFTFLFLSMYNVMRIWSLSKLHMIMMGNHASPSQVSQLGHVSNSG